MPSLLLRPGMLIRLKQQPWDLPDFVLERFLGDTCWIRQQSWGPHVYLRIKMTQIAIPPSPVTYRPLPRPLALPSPVTPNGA